jgi:hypothetical protein
MAGFVFFPQRRVICRSLWGVAQAFYLDRAAATTGLWCGALIGLGSGLFLCLVALPVVFLAVKAY